MKKAAALSILTGLLFFQCATYVHTHPVPKNGAVVKKGELILTGQSKPYPISNRETVLSDSREMSRFLLRKYLDRVLIQAVLNCPHTLSAKRRKYLLFEISQISAKRIKKDTKNISYQKIGFRRMDDQLHIAYTSIHIGIDAAARILSSAIREANDAVHEKKYALTPNELHCIEKQIKMIFRQL